MQEELLAVASEPRVWDEKRNQRALVILVALSSLCFCGCRDSSTIIVQFCACGTALDLVALYSIVKRKFETVSLSKKHNVIGTTWSGEVAFVQCFCS